ncbi:MAG: hypothetical protein SF053_14135 [Bacteroidia bacterium]|nr:hypothetical protein [Bacteroidia bacterium]
MLPPILKDAAKKGDFADVDKLEAFLESETEKAPLEDEKAVDYFLFVAKASLNWFLTYRDAEHFLRLPDRIRHRLGTVRNMAGASAVHAGWEPYLQLLEASFQRIVRVSPIEQFEAHISNLDWSALGKEFIPAVSTTIGYVYLHEEDQDQIGKSRIWLQKSLNESQPEDNLQNLLLMASYHLQAGGQDAGLRLREISQQIQHIADNNKASQAALAALAELEARILSLEVGAEEDPLARQENALLVIQKIETQALQHTHLTGFGRMAVLSLIASLYMSLRNMTDDDLEQNGYIQQAHKYAEAAVEQANLIKNTHGVFATRLQRGQIIVQSEISLTEKEVKEIIAHYRKTQDQPLYIQACMVFTGLMSRNETAPKIHDLLQEIIKNGSKKIDEGGFYLIISALRMGNDIFLKEIEEPGITWAIPILDQFFDKIQKTIDELDELIPKLGKSMLETFRNEFIRFEPVSHFNIKTYFRYQLYEVKVMRLGALINGDTISRRLAEQLLGELEDNRNPLSFVKADWDEFRKIPNMVRNYTINKCINISKGDLPLAAEHLEFSYRNLRSYITFKEVNRLGFFLDLQQTSNRQLEQGIRYMFFDLYRNGTIFEVVFDMPRFLVKYSKSGFFSQDMERELKIKGTTAKKYLKIMIDMKMIRQDKTTGRKHFYRLIRENVMNRLGKDQTTLIK